MKEKVLVVGGGGREHAIVAALQRSEARIYAVMKNRNPGIARACVEHSQIKETDTVKVTEFAQKVGVDLAIIGPESPLESGVSDALRIAGIPCVGPSKAAARLETSKSFARDLLQRHGVAGNLRYASFDDAAQAKAHLDSIDYQVAVKPVGLTGGKGVKVEGEHLRTKDEVKQYVDEIFQQRIGGAGVVLEEKAEGEEFTLQVFCDGKDIALMPLVQDHKRAYEGDEGPNTGGMGSYSDSDHLLPFVRSSEKEEAASIIGSVARALRADGHPYQGVIYGQFMLTKDGPKVIEFNARFGDPEAMNVLTLFSSNFLETAWGVATGNLTTSKVGFLSKATVCKYVVPRGYGTEPMAGLPVEVDEKAIGAIGASAYYAAVNEEGGQILTGTSRSVGVVGVGDTIAEANDICEAALHHVKGKALYVRHDIGGKELVQRRVDHMRSVRGGSK